MTAGPDGRGPTRRAVRSSPIEGAWELCHTAPDACADPGSFPAEIAWRPAVVPGTVAQAIGPTELDGHHDYDGVDWWYRTTFSTPDTNARHALRFDGLATVAEVWLNGQSVLQSDNMFVPRRVDVTEVLAPGDNELLIVFRSLGSILVEKRPRPRWKTRLVTNQRLRWIRTTLLGRIPGWTPSIAPVGPWRPVELETLEPLRAEELHIFPGWDGEAGTLRVHCSVPDVDGDTDLTAAVEVAGQRYALTVEPGPAGRVVSGIVTIPDVDPWWPHTHGTPRQYPVRLVIGRADEETTVECGNVGFRSVVVDESDGRVQFVVNGEEIFCRGACWTTTDIVSLDGDPERLKRTLALLAEANANMVRVGGTMVYESDQFYDTCDELGLMVWQDFMFANMDYPVEDPDFSASVTLEARLQVRRLAEHACVVAWCGGSEVEQQAAMFGAARDVWLSPLFTELLPRVLDEEGVILPYWPSTPTGGAMPFYVGEGIAHYYGVGAYRRPLADARLAEVKFSPECLGFSNVPEPWNLRKLSPHGIPAPHDPSWKRGVPRDTGAGWDFEDVRDHYLNEIYGVDAVDLRTRDLDTYMRLSRAVTGHVLSHVFDEWRSSTHACSGGLLWVLNDLRPGAGWGIIDSDARPKPAYWYVKRAWAPRRIALLDRGLEGTWIEVHNERPESLEGVLEVSAVDRNGVAVVTGSRDLSVPPRGHVLLSATELWDRFVDTPYTYAFGPETIALVTAEWHGSDGFGPDRCTRWTSMRDLPLAQLSVEWPSESEISVTSDGIARDVRIECDSVLLGDNYFDLLPGQAVKVRAERIPGTPVRGAVEAENCPDGVRLPRPEG